METKTSDLALVGIILSALAMSVGCDFRGDYGRYLSGGCSAFFTKAINNPIAKRTVPTR